MDSDCNTPTYNQFYMRHKKNIYTYKNNILAYMFVDDQVHDIIDHNCVQNSMNCKFIFMYYYMYKKKNSIFLQVKIKYTFT